MRRRGFDRFVADRGQALWRAAWLLTSDSQHAEDLVQTAFSKCFIRYDDMDGDESFEAYVRTAIYRTFVSGWRQRSWRGEVPGETVAESGTPETSSSLRIDIMRALDGLPRMQRAVLVLHRALPKRYRKTQPRAEYQGVTRAVSRSDSTYPALGRLTSVMMVRIPLQWNTTPTASRGCGGSHDGASHRGGRRVRRVRVGARRCTLVGCVAADGWAHHAEDLVQSALTKTYGRYTSFDNDRHFESYVRTTIYRTFVSWWRRRAWRSEVPTAVHSDATATADGDAALREDLLRALASLPRMQRAVLVLRYFEDRPTKEVAEMLGIPVGTVTSHSSRGLKALRLSTHLRDPEDDS